MSVDKQIYLEHFGVKGMRWGQRKSHSNRSSSKKSNKKKLAARIAVGAGVGIAGGLVLGKLIQKSGRLPVRDLRSSAFTSSGKDWLLRSNEASNAAFLTTTLSEIYTKMDIN